MANENMNSKLSIKNMLFTRAIPNYVIPVPTDGHKIYGCTDCGDKFLFKSSHDYHVNRKSVLITYMCRHCHQVKIFNNRCNLLSHIRSHAFKSATINVSDLKVEPLPMSEFISPVDSPTPPQKQPEEEKSKKKRTTNTVKRSFCFECNEDITQSGVLYKDRGIHYMRHINEMHTCPVCLFVMPTKCAFQSHMRIHNEEPPYYCPECGVHLPNKSVNYPFSHGCYGFNMMRATMRVKCPIRECGVFHPSNYQTHMMEHMKKVYKCSVCIAACFNKEAITKHLVHHCTPSKKYTLFFQCQMCPGRLVLGTQLDSHLKMDHPLEYVHPCWTCGTVFENVKSLLHHSKICKQKTGNENKKADPNIGNKNIMYRVVKRCDRCKLFFTYKCKYEEISDLPSECPYKCTPGEHVMEVSRTEQGLEESNLASSIICHLCKNNMPNDWTEIKKHFANLHKEYRCLDARVNLERLDISKYINKHKKSVKPVGVTKNRIIKKITVCDNKPKTQMKKHTENASVIELSPKTDGNNLVCNKCGEKCNSKKKLEEHMMVHRDPCTAYQCLECGKCFVVKPSFTTHLLVEHGISDIDDYINSKQCYNEDAFIKYQNTVTNDEPLLDNQCNICREQFNNLEDLEKHFRVHGMAFLMKTTKNNSSP